MGGDEFEPGELAALRQAAAETILSARRSGSLPPLALKSALRRLDAVLRCTTSARGSPESVGGEQSNVEWLDSVAAAALLQISPRRVRQLAPQLGGELWSGRWRFPRTTLEEHLNGCRRVSAPGRRGVDRQPF